MATRQDLEAQVRTLEQDLARAKRMLARFDDPECGVGDDITIDGYNYTLVEAAPGYVTLLDEGTYRTPDIGIMVKVENLYDITAREMKGICGGAPFTVADNSFSAQFRNA